ncbi:hypothetical protein CVT25_000924 [Psilocybe cyanescens]|uniref:Uncharacterized protein n=1 Tax=Psilocybe cyanescens TaxID=93625 RepID=A0A409X8S7_PSICY|nr:hypothetical protein CVT25_000924 [Psilocybe cyanescens]
MPPSDFASASIPDVLDNLTTEEAILFTAGVGFWHTHAVERLGVPAIKVSDGPNGLRGNHFFMGTRAKCLPVSPSLLPPLFQAPSLSPYPPSPSSPPSFLIESHSLPSSLSNVNVRRSTFTAYSDLTSSLISLPHLPPSLYSPPKPKPNSNPPPLPFPSHPPPSARRSTLCSSTKSGASSSPKKPSCARHHLYWRRRVISSE